MDWHAGYILCPDQVLQAWLPNISHTAEQQSCAEQGYKVYEHLFPQNSSEIFKRKQAIKKMIQFKLETSKMIHCAWHLVTTMKKISVCGLEIIWPLRMKTTSRCWVSE